MSSWKGEWNCTIEWFVCKSFLDHLRPTRVYLNKITLDASFSRVTHSGDHSPTLRLPNSPSRQLASSLIRQSFDTKSTRMRHRGTAPAFLHVHVYALSSSPAPQRAYSPSLSFAQHFALSLPHLIASQLPRFLAHSLSYSPTLLLSITCPLHQSKV